MRTFPYVFASLLLWILLTALGLFAAAAHATGSVVTVDTNNALVVNGKKVFPIGFSPGPPLNGVTPTGYDGMQELRDAGGLIYRMNQTTNWNSQVMADQQSILDWAGQHGMFVWLNLREVSQFASTDTNTAATLRTVVDTFRNHPALGLWKNFDEAWWSGVSVSDLLNGYNVIKQEDTNHPVVQTHAPRGMVSDLQPYNVAADVLAVDIYPIVAAGTASNPPVTNTQVSQVGDWANEIAQVANGQKEFWLIEQIAFSGTTPPAKPLIFPTYQQSRFMAYQVINNGARGLMFFGGNVTSTLNAQDLPLGWNWTFWTNVLKPLVQQLGDHSLLADALVAPASTLPITFSGATAPDIEFCVREVPPYLYILASKREGATVNVTFSGLPTWAALGDVLYESPRRVSAQNGQFSDTFAQWDVHVYRFVQSNQPPVILSQPQSTTNFLGTTAVFNVGAGGTAPLSYQWRKNTTNLSNGGNISGATSSSLTVSNVAASDAANYDVIVTGIGSVTSAPPAVLTVNTQTNQSPVINSQPQSRTNAAGTTASFGIAATGSGTLTYQWRKNSVNLTNVGNVSGATSTNLVLTNVSSSDAAVYDVVVTGFGSVTSAPPAVLTIAEIPIITVQPQSRTNNAGSTAVFTVGASGAGLTYQWAKNSVNLSEGGNVSGSKSATLTLTGVSFADMAGYSVVVSNLSGGQPSGAASLTVIYPMPYFDPINYPAGANLGSQINGNYLTWADVGTSVAGPYVIVGTNSLSVPGLAPSTGNCIRFGGLGKSARFSLPVGNPVISGTLYYSFAFQVPDTNGLSSNGVFVAGFNNSVGTQTPQPTVFGTRLYLHSTNGGFNVGVSKSSSTPTDWFWDPRLFTTNQILFIVGSYTFDPAGDISKLWVNPSSATFGAAVEPAPSLINSNGANISGNQLASVVFAQRATNQPALALADELRMGTSWTDVTPPGPPTPPKLIGLANPGNGMFQFGYTNNSGHTYSVYMSTNLVNWMSIGVATETAPAFYQFFDSAASNNTRRFYQLRSP